MSDTRSSSKSTIKISIYQLVGGGLFLCGFIFYLLVEFLHFFRHYESRILFRLFQVGFFLMIIGFVVLILGYIARQLVGER